MNASQAYSESLLTKILHHITLAENGCWIWLGSRSRNDYARMTAYGTTQLVHRLIFEIVWDMRIPPKMEIDHLCRNKPCVNPSHLELVTVRENALRAASFIPRPTHCPAGHPRIPENLRVSKRGGKGRVGFRVSCRLCWNATLRRWNAKRRAKQ